MKSNTVILSLTFAAATAWGQQSSPPNTDRAPPAAEVKGSVNVSPAAPPDEKDAGFFDFLNEPVVPAPAPEVKPSAVIPAPGGEVKKFESKSSSSESSESSKSSSSATESSFTTSVNGKTMNITRRRDGEGKETVTVTTIRSNGKPQVEELTPEEFERKYGKRKKKDTPAKPSGLPEKKSPEPATPGKATE